VASFVLVPGAWHGAWCWEPLLPELARLGHEGVAVDLPCDDVDAGFDRYVEITGEALDDAGPDAILVGHSLGAHTAARAALARPIAHIVYVCGVIPPRSGEDTSEEPPMEVPQTFDDLVNRDGLMWWPADGVAATAAMYADCSPEDAGWAVARLRKQSTTPHRALGELIEPVAPSTSIVCADDRVVRAEWGRWAARERLRGAPVIEVPGGHSPFLSRPAILAATLDGIARAAG